MSNIEIVLTGPDGSRVTMHNDWDQCEARGLMHIEDLEGWYGGVGANVTPDVKRFRRHGKFPARSIRSHRKLDLTLTWHYSISDEEDAYSAYARWASSFAWDFGPYGLEVIEDGLRLSTSVLLDGEIQYQNLEKGSEQAFRVRIPLRAQDPFLYGDERTTIVSPNGDTPVAANDPFGQGLTNASGEQVFAWFGNTQKPQGVYNSGTADAYPKFDVIADDSRGVSITMGGGTVEYRGPLFSQSPLTIDMYGSALLDGRDVSHRLVSRGWTPLRPGETAVPRISLTGSGSGYANCRVRDAFI